MLLSVVNDPALVSDCFLEPVREEALDDDVLISADWCILKGLLLNILVFSFNASDSYGLEDYIVLSIFPFLFRLIEPDEVGGFLDCNG